MYSAMRRLPADVGWPAYVDVRSFARNGTPEKGPWLER
jgi:hypothetical protein